MDVQRRDPDGTRRARRRGWRVLAVAAVCALAATACGSNAGSNTSSASGGSAKTAGLTTVRMVQEWPVADGFWIPWIVAQKQGFYRQAGINLQIIPPPNTSATAQYIGTGRADLAFDTSMDVVFARAQGAPMVSVGRYGSGNNWGLISSPDKPLDFASIKGKTIGTYNDSWSKAQLQIMLSSQGLSLSDVHLVTASSDTVPLLLQKKVDAITGVTNSEGSELESQGMKNYSMTLAKDHGVPNSPVWVLAANSTWLSGHQATAQKFMDATVQGLKYAIAHPTEAVDDFMAAYPSAQSRAFTTLQWQSTISLFGKNPGASGFAQSDADWASLLKAANDYKLVNKTDSPSAYYTNQLLGSK
jgi:putative hydroxymethylpyrimidine transport system substrate-binding protein